MMNQGECAHSYLLPRCARLLAPKQGGVWLNCHFIPHGLDFNLHLLLWSSMHVCVCVFVPSYLSCIHWLSGQKCCCLAQGQFSRASGYSRTHADLPNATSFAFLSGHRHILFSHRLTISASPLCIISHTKNNLPTNFSWPHARLHYSSVCWSWMDD